MRTTGTLPELLVESQRVNGKQRGFIDLRGAFYAMFILGFLAAFALFFVLPWVWRLLKPWLHQVTG